MFCRHFKDSKQKKTLRFHLELNFNNFQGKRMENFQSDWYNILTIGIDKIGFRVNMISELDFFTIVHIFLLYILLEGKYYSFFTCGFFS